MLEPTRNPYSKVSPLRLAALATLVALAGAGAARALVYQYDNTDVTSNGIPQSATCASFLERTFTVTDSFMVEHIGVGLNVSHATRREIRAILVAPDNSTFQFIPGSAAGNSSDNYDILVSSNSDAGEPGEAPVNDTDDDPVAAPFFNRLVTVAGMDFYTGNASGTWRLRVCDINNNGTSGTYNRAQLMLTSSATAASVCTSRVSYDWGANGDGVAFTSATVGGITISQGTTTNYSSGRNSGTNWNFRTDTDALGTHTGFYSLYMDAANTAGTQDSEIMGQEVTFTFNVAGTPYAVQDLEYSTLDSDQADGDFEDYLHIEAAAVGGGFVPFSRTPASGSPVFQDAGDSIEGDAACDNAQNCATEAYKFARAVLSTTIGYFAGDDVTSEPGDQVVGISDFQFCAFDLGDAPNTYGTRESSNGARHVLANRLIYMGSIPPDGETQDADSAAATNDDTRQVGGVDDEDGVASFPAFTAGSSSYTVSVNATNTSGSPGFLVGYIDWNRDGDFNDTGEKSLTTNVANGTFAPTAANVNVTWNPVPNNAGGNSATYARFRISTNSSAVGSPVGLAPDGEVEDYPITAGTLPVTVAWVETARERGALAVRFMTSSENQNAGFRIWGVSEKGERSLLGRIPSKVVDSFAPQSYELRVAGEDVAAVEIEDIGTNGRNRLHGPFGVGTTVGERPEGAAIDWSAIRAENESTLADQRTSAAEAATRLLADATTGGPEGTTSLALIRVREEGLHRLTYEQLLAAGIDLASTNAKLSRIALYDHGVAIPRYVSSPSSTFGPGAYIEFLAHPQLTLASPFDALELRVDRRDFRNPDTAIAAVGAPDVTEAVLSNRPDRAFSPSAPNGDPWYDARLLSFGSPVQATRSFDLPNLADGPVELTVEAWGYTYFDGAAPDHHIVVRVNGTEVASQTFDGLTAWNATFDVADLVQAAGNTLEVVVPGDTGYGVDLINLEGFAVDYRRATVALDGRFRGRPLVAGAPYAVDGFADGPVVAWSDAAGLPTRTELTAVAGRVTVADPSAEAFLAQPNRMLTPEVVAGVPIGLTAKKANYLIITHPLFGNSLGDLVALEQSRGFSTGVVNVERIYAAYSDHAPSAEAIRRFIAASSQGGQLKYVLLVGADSSDPYDHLGLGSISFLPTAYLPVVPDVSFSPTDEAIADIDGDLFPDKPIGRLPVRTVAELSNAVAKLYAWDAAVVGSPSALLTSGASDAPGELPSINVSYGDALGGWGKTLAQVDDLGVTAVRQQVIAGMNAGVPLVSFVGHSSPGQWDFTPILRWQDVGAFTNTGRPNLVTQWGCWNSYYVEPGYECMSGRLLRTQDVGAAGTIGASTLTTDASHRRLGVLFFQQMAAKPTRLGDAFLAAKRTLRSEGGAQDAILGMALLGDPAMPLPFAPPAR